MDGVSVLLNIENVSLNPRKYTGKKVFGKGEHIQKSRSTIIFQRLTIQLPAGSDRPRHKPTQISG